MEPNGTVAEAFSKPAMSGRFSIIETGSFLLDSNCRLGKYDSHGNIQPGPWPIDYSGMVPFEATYSGVAMLTRGALWEMGGYGYLARYTREFKPIPGAVASPGWKPCFPTTQIADAPADSFYIKSIEALYVARVDDERIHLLHRFGSIPRALSLNITSAGTIGVGDETLMCWYDFDDADSAAPPVKSQYFGPAAQGFEDGDGCVSVDSGGYPVDYPGHPLTFRLCRFSPTPLDGTPASDPVVSAAAFPELMTSVAKVGSWYFAIDTKGRLSSSAASDTLHFRLCDVVGVTSIAAYGPDRLLVAITGAIQCYKLGTDGAFDEDWQLTGPQAGDAFGSSLCVASSGGQVLVSDTDKNRAVLFGAGTSQESAPTLLAQFGETGVSGDDFRHLSAPTLVAISGGRAAVYDSGNQRVVKLSIR